MPGERVRALGARTIVAAIADAAERWRDGDFPPRVRASGAIEARLGYTLPVIDYALDRLFFPIRAAALEAAIAAELDSIAALDGFAARPSGPEAWARGVERVVIISSDSTIGVAVVPAIFALCAKCDIVVKDRSDALVAAFFETLAHEHPAFAASARARTWRGGNDADERTLIANADVVVAFGRDDTLREIRAVTSVDARFVAYGHRVSIGIVDLDRDVLDDVACARILTDALLYDGEGCLSLHALFAVGGDGAAADRLTRGLARAAERVAIEFPQGGVDPARAAAEAAYRNLAAFRGAAGRGGVVRANGSTLVLDPPRDEPPPLLPRVLPIFRFGSLDDVAAYVDAHRLPVQAIGTLDPSAERCAIFAERIGAVRVAPFGAMQAPPLESHHGGRPRIADFVRWIDRA